MRKECPAKHPGTKCSTRVPRRSVTVRRATRQDMKRTQWDRRRAAPVLPATRPARRPERTQNRRQERARSRSTKLSLGKSRPHPTALFLVPWLLRVLARVKLARPERAAARNDAAQNRDAQTDSHGSRLCAAPLRAASRPGQEIDAHTTIASAAGAAASLAEKVEEAQAATTRRPPMSKHIAVIAVKSPEPRRQAQGCRGSSGTWRKFRSRSFQFEKPSRFIQSRAHREGNGCVRG